MENKILPLMTEEQRKQVTKEVINQYRGKVLAIGLILTFVTGFAVSYAIVTEIETERIKENIRTHHRIDSVLGRDLIGDAYYKNKK